jgi:hypothetical protein
MFKFQTGGGHELVLLPFTLGVTEAVLELSEATVKDAPEPLPEDAPASLKLAHYNAKARTEFAFMRKVCAIALKRGNPSVDEAWLLENLEVRELAPLYYAIMRESGMVEKEPEQGKVPSP